MKSQRETHIQSMYDQLEALWKRLAVEEADIDEFVERNRGSTDESVRAVRIPRFFPQLATDFRL